MTDEQKQKRMREQLKAIEEENAEVRKRRSEKAEKSTEEITKSLEAKGRATHSSNRENRRLGSSGIPRSVIYGQKMKVPRGRR